MQEYPWRLKLVHEGFRCIRVERPGRFLSFEPEEAFHEVGLFLGGDEERLRGLHATANKGGGGVLLPEFLQKQLGEMGGIEMQEILADNSSICVCCIHWRLIVLN